MMQEVISCLDGVITRLEPLLKLANCHMVDFFTKDLWSVHVNGEISKEILSDPCSAIGAVFDPHPNFPTLNEFFVNADAAALHNFKSVCIDMRTLQEKFSSMGCRSSPLRLELFMSPKKIHEVEILSEILSCLHVVGGTSHIVDIGDGKGYLSSALAVHNQFKVLGIDASHVNTHGAVKRLQKLQKVSSANDVSNLYKQATEFVTGNTNIELLLTNNFPNDKNSKISLVGLHTCGNLAASAVKLFHKTDSIKTLCNVSCCYHLIEEEAENDFSGFPLSTYLKNKEFKLGRNARMLASQSVDRILHNREIPTRVLFYRSLLQVVLCKYFENTEDIQVGRMSGCDNFVQYVHKAFRKMKMKCEVSEKDLQDLHDKYVDREIFVQIFYFLRARLAPAVESVILLDRLLYLRERGYGDAVLARLFDPVVSPRCYGLIAVKSR